MPPLLESSTIDGRPCRIQYLSVDLVPVTKDRHDIAYIKFENGEHRYEYDRNDSVASHVVKLLLQTSGKH